MTLERGQQATGRYLIEAGIATIEELRRWQMELSAADPGLDGRCPLDAERLRSREAVLAYGAWLYVLVRALRPNVIIETGVQNGCSTELILWALHRNRCGRLHSIDSGATSSDGSHRTPWHQTWDGIPGRDVLRGLRDHWDLTIGLTQDHLLRVCRMVGAVDFFWHDSDHSSANVSFEFGTVKPFVPSGGALCLHDFEGQETTLEEGIFPLVVPQQAPYLRVWRRT